jgi:3D-(3,5/4)-trihydroxycyclohexane-1,2-dione acylhydrolase (decyclizing)
VTLSLPQDVQAEAFDYPSALFEPRIWTIPRPRGDRAAIQRAVELVRASRRPMIVAGGGVIYSEATEALRQFAEATGIAVGDTQAGKGALPDPHPLSLGGVGATGTLAANRLAREADVVLVIGSRLSDFTTASKTAFQHPAVRFIGVNIAEFDAAKQAALAVVGDARAVLEELTAGLAGYRVDAGYTDSVKAWNAEWRDEVRRVCAERPDAAGARMTQAQAIGILQDTLGPRDVIVGAAGSLPGDLHKLWRARDPKGYHLEYGYSCMGYEIAGGLGAKLAAPDRDVYVLVGDGSYLMMAQEIVTAIQEGVKLTVVLFDNQGFASIGGLSEAVGSGGFGTRYRYRNAATGDLDGDVLPVDLAANAASLGARVYRADTAAQLRSALAEARNDRTIAVVVVAVDRDVRVGGYESWWDVPVAEVSIDPAVQRARAAYEAARRGARDFL